MDKLERLLTLTMTLLQTPRPLTASEIHERVPGYPSSHASFRRAFERDKDSLREMGIPLTMTHVSFSDPPVEGYRIREDEYYLRDPGFEPDELAALHLAATTVRLDSAHTLEGLWKLGSADPDGTDAEVGHTTVALPGDTNLGPLFGAVAEHRAVAFTYNDRRREVDPHRLDFQRGRWYLTAFDHDRGEERNYRVDRIAGEVEVRGAARREERPDASAPGGPAQPWQFGEGDPTTAYLLVDAAQAPWARQHLGAQTIVEDRPDGAIVAAVAVTNWPAFRSFVLTFLEHAEILSPPELRDEMIQWLQGIAPATAGADG